MRTLAADTEDIYIRVRAGKQYFCDLKELKPEPLKVLKQ
jgi:hypothetical protein